MSNIERQLTKALNITIDDFIEQYVYAIQDTIQADFKKVKEETAKQFDDLGIKLLFHEQYKGNIPSNMVYNSKVLRKLGTNIFDSEKPIEEEIVIKKASKRGKSTYKTTYWDGKHFDRYEEDAGTRQLYEEHSKEVYPDQLHREAVIMEPKDIINDNKLAALLEERMDKLSWEKDIKKNSPGKGRKDLTPGQIRSILGEEFPIKVIRYAERRKRQHYNWRLIEWGDPIPTAHKIIWKRTIDNNYIALMSDNPELINSEPHVTAPQSMNPSGYNILGKVEEQTIKRILPKIQNINLKKVKNRTMYVSIIDKKGIKVKLII